MGSATTDSEVALSKTISVSGDRLRVDYRIDPLDADAGRVRLVEQFSEPVERADITFSDQNDGHWEYVSSEEVEFLGDFNGSDPLTTTLQLQTVRLAPEDCTSTVTATPADIEHPRSNGRGSDTWVRDSEAPLATPNARHDGNHRTPAIGVVATAENTAAVARTTVRATDRGLSVFAAVDEDQEQTARIVDRLGATVIQLDIGDRDTDELTTALAGTAKSRSYPGILFHGECGDRMAFGDSLKKFETQEKSIVETLPEPGRTEVLIGIPAYNEAQTVKTVVKESRKHADEVLVVDDGSSDGTADCAREAGATVVEHDSNRGYGHALKTIFKQADNRDVDSLVILDGDNQHDSGDIPRLLSKQQESGAEIVIGSRFGDGTETDIPLYRWFGLSVITVLTNLSMGNFCADSRIQDTQSGFRSYDATAVKKLAENTDAIDDRMSASIDILSFAHANGFTTTEVPTTIAYDVKSANTQNPLTHGLNIIHKIGKTLERNRPITILGIPGVLVSLVGVGVAHWTISNFLTTGQISIVFTVVSALLILFGTLTSFFSLMLHSLNTYLSELTSE